MRLDGALRPHGAPVLGRSIGAKRYRDKRSVQQPTNNNMYYNKQRKLQQLATANLSSVTELEETCNNSDKINSKITEFLTATQLEKLEQVQNKGNRRNTNNHPYKVSSNKNNKRLASTMSASDNIDSNSPNHGTLVSIARWCIEATMKIMRVQQSLVAKTIRNGAVSDGGYPAGRYGVFSLPTLVICLVYIMILLPNYVICDDGDNNFFVNSFSMGPETTTPEFDYASRGKKKFGDKCENTLECGFPGSICDPKKKSCQCTEDLRVTNHIDKCGKEAAVNESCFFNEQCESFYFQTECRDGRCICRFEMTPILGKDGVFECKGRGEKRGPETYIDPAMIGVLVGMALMFIIICVVLRLFSQARWRENRTIFNTPNPRLMNVSLLRDSKLLHGQERRGSRMSVRAPSRQPSMASLRPHSPNPSLGSRSGSHGSGSNASGTSIKSIRSNSVAPGNVVNTNHERKGSAPHQHSHQHQHHHQQQLHSQQQPLITNITSNPVAENITVEIIEPEK